MLRLRHALTLGLAVAAAAAAPATAQTTPCSDDPDVAGCTVAYTADTAAEVAWMARCAIGVRRCSFSSIHYVNGKACDFDMCILEPAVAIRTETN